MAAVIKHDRSIAVFYKQAKEKRNFVKGQKSKKSPPPMNFSDLAGLFVQLHTSMHASP